MGAPDVVGELHDLAGGWGLPGAIEWTVDRLPGSLTADVAYDVAVRLGLLTGDLAGVVQSATHPVPECAIEHPSSTAARARHGSGDDGVVASAMAVAVLRPIVHPWMVVDPEIVWHAVARLDELGPRLRWALSVLQIDPGTVDSVGQAVDETRRGLSELADTLATDGAQVRRLTHHLAGARRMRPHTDRLTAADIACRDALVRAAHLVPDLSTVLRGTAWERPPVAADRSALDGLPTAELESIIAQQPDIAAHLTDPHTSDAPSWLTPALIEQRGNGETPDPVAESLRRVSRVRAACAEQGPDALARAALLYPRTMGGLDGVPLPCRYVANRLLMRADLTRLREADLDAQYAIAEQRRRDAATPWTHVRGAVLDAWLSSERITAIATIGNDRLGPLRTDHRAMIALTHQLLHEHLDQGRGELLRRQIAQYDPAGRVVEVFGHLDERTQRVAVYVGGTGTTPRQYGWPTGISRSLQRADAPDTTAVVTWMGAEFPNAIGTQSPSGRFARLAAVPLRNCVEGLSVPDGVSITAVAHSYGGVVVGAAEAVGLRVDRVVHAGVPGLGPGVRSVAAYPSHDALGRARDVTRFCLTAPGDLIRWWRRGDAAIEAAGAAVKFGLVTSASRRFFDRTLGADPTRAPGVIELDTGIWETAKEDRRVGEILFGPRGHADTVEPGTTSFRRIVEIVQGRDPRAVAPPEAIVPFRWSPRRSARR